MKEYCDVLCHNYVDPASIYRIVPQMRPDPNRIQIHGIRPDPDPDPTRIHQIHQISGQIRTGIRCTSSFDMVGSAIQIVLTYYYNTTG